MDSIFFSLRIIQRLHQYRVARRRQQIRRGRARAAGRGEGRPLRRVPANITSALDAVPVRP